MVKAVLEVSQLQNYIFKFFLLATIYLFPIYNSEKSTLLEYFEYFFFSENPCEDGNYGGCDKENASCKDVDGLAVCSCLTGYEGNGKTCNKSIIILKESKRN